MFQFLQNTTVGDYCKYEDKGHPYLKLGPLKLEVLLDEPMVHMYHDIVSDKDIAEMKRMASSTVSVFNPNGSYTKSLNTGCSIWLIARFCRYQNKSSVIVQNGSLQQNATVHSMSTKARAINLMGHPAFL